MNAIFNEEALRRRFRFHQGSIYLQDKALLNQTIYRRMSLNSFKRILEDKTFYVSRKYRFSDKKEGADSISFGYVISHFSVAGHPETIVKHDDERPENIYAAVVPVSCWSINGSDRFMRWKAYDHGGVEVMVKTTVGAFLSELEASTYHVYVSRVQYGRRTFNPDYDGLFWKSEGYVDEDEIRFCFVEDDWRQFNDRQMDDGVKLELKDLHFIQEIWVASMNSRQKAVEAYQELRNDSALGNLVHLSSLTEEPSYKVYSKTLSQLSSGIVRKLEEKNLKQPSIQLNAWKRIREWMENPKMKGTFSQGGKLRLPIDKTQFKSAYLTSHPTPSNHLSGADDTVINLMYRLLEEEN